MFFLLFQLRLRPAIAGHHSYCQNKHSCRLGADGDDFKKFRPTFLRPHFLFLLLPTVFCVSWDPSQYPRSPLDLWIYLREPAEQLNDRATKRSIDPLIVNLWNGSIIGFVFFVFFLLPSLFALIPWRDAS